MFDAKLTRDIIYNNFIKKKKIDIIVKSKVKYNNFITTRILV